MGMTHEDFARAQAYWTERDARPDAKRMPPGELRGAVEAFARSHRVGALATGAGDFVRCTPLEYDFAQGAFWIFTEGGLKFRGLEANPNVCLAVFDTDLATGSLAGMQVSGVARVVDPDDAAFAAAARRKGLDPEALRGLPMRLHLLRVEPRSVDLLDASLRAQGYDARQHLEVAADAPDA